MAYTESATGNSPPPKPKPADNKPVPSSHSPSGGQPFTPPPPKPADNKPVPSSHSPSGGQPFTPPPSSGSGSSPESSGRIAAGSASSNNKSSKKGGEERSNNSGKDPVTVDVRSDPDLPQYQDPNADQPADNPDNGNDLSTIRMKQDHPLVERVDWARRARPLTVDALFNRPATYGPIANTLFAHLPEGFEDSLEALAEYMKKVGQKTGQGVWGLGEVPVGAGVSTQLIASSFLQDQTSQQYSPEFKAKLVSLLDQFEGGKYPFFRYIQGPPELLLNKYGESSEMASALIASLENNKSIDQASVERLIKWASEQNTAGRQGGLAGLFALTLADKQHIDDPSYGKLFEKATGIAWNGGAGGNCATFVSAVMYYAGVQTTELWGLGKVGNSGAIPFLGTDNFRTALSVADTFRGNGLPDNVGLGQTYYIGYGDLYAGHVNFYRPVSGDKPASVESKDAQENIYPNIGPGDLFVIAGQTADSSKPTWDHVAVIVGYGAVGGGPNEPFYPTYKEAVDHSPGTEIVPYAVDNGGNNAQVYPRPIGIWSDNPQSTYIIDVGYR